MSMFASETVPDSVRTELDRVQIVLCGTSHSGNLGAVARAMKNMGLTRLVLVAPSARIDDQAIATAKHAVDILHQARIVPDLETALADSIGVWATSARVRELNLPVSDARAAADTIRETLARHRGTLSILFGAERTGLTNEELTCAQHLIEISANPAYPVLNLGQAVQIVAYELRMARPGTPPERAVDDDRATMAELSAFEARLAGTLDPTSFFVRGATDPSSIAQNRARLLSKVQILCRRAQPTRNELAILQGMLSALTAQRRPDETAARELS